MAPRALLDRLAALFPDFAAYWDDPGNCFRDDDGSFTLHGVFCQFTDYFRERYDGVALDRVAALGAFISESLASGDSDLDNAAATCFIENIAGEPCDRDLARHLTGQARECYRAWGGRA